LKNFILILLSATVIAHLGYIVIESGIRKFNPFSYSRLDEIVNGKEKFDIVFFGSSRTQCHINPCIIDSLTGLNSYNAGKAGSNSLEVRMLLEAYLETHIPPKYVVYNIDNLTVSNLNTVPNSNLYLFFLNNKKMAQYLEGTFTHVEILRLIPFTRLLYFDDYLRNVAIQGHFSKTEVLNSINYCKGHASNTQDTIKDSEIVPNISKISSPDLTHVLAIIEICKENKIKLIFNSTPVIYLNNLPTSNQRVAKIDEVANRSKIDFIRFDTSKAFSKNDFIDLGHLNRLGSIKYSKLFANELNRKLISN